MKRGRLNILDSIDELALVCKIAPLEKLLTQIIAARGVTQLFRPVKDGIDENDAAGVG